MSYLEPALNKQAWATLPSHAKDYYQQLNADTYVLNTQVVLDNYSKHPDGLYAEVHGGKTGFRWYKDAQGNFTTQAQRNLNGELKSSRVMIAPTYEQQNNVRIREGGGLLIGKTDNEVQAAARVAAEQAVTTKKPHQMTDEEVAIATRVAAEQAAREV